MAMKAATDNKNLDYPRLALHDSRRLLREEAWQWQKRGCFRRQDAALLLWLRMIDLTSDCAPRDPEMKWRPRVDLSRQRGGRQMNNAAVLAELTGRDKSNVAKDLKFLRGWA